MPLILEIHLLSTLGHREDVEGEVEFLTSSHMLVLA